MGDHHAEEEDQPARTGFARGRHAAYLQAMASGLPRNYDTQEVMHLTLAYFAVAGLSLLGALDWVNKDDIAEWILSFQVHPKANEDLDNGQFYGFCGNRSTQYPSNTLMVRDPCHNGSHLASTYSALAILKIVGYDILNLDSKVLLLSMRNLQQPDGSFMPTHIGAETDLRFVYCAAAICSMLKDWSGMDKEKAREHIINCQSYDGGFGMVPGSESHGGGTFCAVAALHLMGFIQPDLASNLRESGSIDVQLLLEWCLQRQATDGGFQGRRNKPSDTCYGFWIGGVLKMLGAYHLIDHAVLREFLLTCQTDFGGFSKFPDFLDSDPCHNGSHLASTYSALAILKIVGYDILNLDSKVLLLSMRNLQQPDGSFMPTHIGAETDLRFVYCAAAICSMLKDWSGMDKEKAREHIINCQSYDGGFGMVPGSESHGGGTFCAVAALHLMGFIQPDLASNLRESGSIDVQLLLEWCLQRQATDGGFQGRRNKPSDTCYGFWIGGVLKMLGAYHLIDHAVLREFLLTCQTDFGGFSKFPDVVFPDIYHSYYGLAAFSLLGEEGVEPLCTELGIIAAAL